jgi:hypothetical protein
VLLGWGCPRNTSLLQEGLWPRHADPIALATAISDI